jgi:high-affinity iron transporter
MALVRQFGLMFVPRVQVMTVGQTLTFTNEDAETHSVHNVGGGVTLNQSMSPGQKIEVVPDRPGVIRLVCDVHSHMRGYVVVSSSPWAAVCGRDGRFRIDDVPEGSYRLQVWHEMGEPLRQKVTIGGAATDLGVLTLTGPAGGAKFAMAARLRPWCDVIDRIAVTLSSSLDAARQPNGATPSRKLADDAYWGEFEGSQMETAVRRYLGITPASELEGRFRAIRADVRKVALGQGTAGHASDLVRQLLLALNKAAEELNRQAIVDGSKIDRAAGPQPLATGPRSGKDPRELLRALELAFESVQERADIGRPADAEGSLTDAYFEAFEPIEREILPLEPMGTTVAQLEGRFHDLRGRVGGGLKGKALTSALDSILDQTKLALNKLDTTSVAAFPTAFGASFITILREGIEVILLLTMLFALVAKTQQPRYLAAVRWGIGLAVVASVGTAIGLNSLVASARGHSQELLEGLIMLAASGVLFYVSYWLISRTEARRWSDFLKRQVLHSAELGSAWTLGLTAFLAIYREGAETALMYQGLLLSQASRLGVAAGLGVGLAVLAVVYVVLRSASTRLPLQWFFKLSGLLLFAMAVVFAGKAVFELQGSGWIRVTPLPWLGEGLPPLGLYPNLQAVSVQGVLLSGAALALVVLLFGGGSQAPARPGSAARTS